MSDMTAGITKASEGWEGQVWHILGQTYTLKQASEDSMAWEAILPPGTFVPPHVHPKQDEFILVLDGGLELWLDGVEVSARPGDLVRMPKGKAHGIYNRGEETARTLFWVAPMGPLRSLFERIHNVDVPAEVARIAGEHEVDFLPPPENA